MPTNRIFQVFVLFVFSSILLVAQNKYDSAKIFKLLQNSINERDFSLIQPVISENFTYAEYKGNFAMSILSQVINQYPKIDSITVSEVVVYELSKNYKVTLWAENGPSEKSIVINNENEIIKAEIASISVASHSSSEKPQTKNTTISNSSVIKIPFKLTATNHIQVKAKINGIYGNFIIDSGTSEGLLLNSNYSSISGEKMDNAPLGVSGKMTNTSKLKVGEFSIENLVINEVEAISTDLSHLGSNMEIDSFAGTIGYKVLKNFIVEFDYQEMLVILYPNKNMFIEGKQNIITNKINMAKHIPVINMKIGQENLRLGIDCGAQGNMLQPKWNEKLKNSSSNPRIEKLSGADLLVQNVEKKSLSNISFANKDYKMDFVFAELFGGNHKVSLIDGLIGYPFLSEQKTAINYIDKEIYFWQ